VFSTASWKIVQFWNWNNCDVRYPATSSFIPLIHYRNA
jgi:hypothetical protein